MASALTLKVIVTVYLSVKTRDNNTLSLICEISFILALGVTYLVVMVRIKKLLNGLAGLETQQKKIQLQLVFLGGCLSSYVITYIVLLISESTGPGILEKGYFVAQVIYCVTILLS